MIHDRRGEAANDDDPQTLSKPATESRGMFDAGTAQPGEEPLRERSGLDSAEANPYQPHGTGEGVD